MRNGLSNSTAIGSKLISVIIVLAMLMAITPTSVIALAFDGNNEYLVGNSVVASLTNDGVLRLKGQGATFDYSVDKPAPWHERLGDIKRVEIEDGITSIGDYLFFNCGKLGGTLTIPQSVSSIGSYAFSGESDKDAPDFRYVFNEYGKPSTSISIGEGVSDTPAPTAELPIEETARPEEGGSAVATQQAGELPIETVPNIETPIEDSPQEGDLAVTKVKEALEEGISAADSPAVIQKPEEQPALYTADIARQQVGYGVFYTGRVGVYSCSAENEDFCKAADLAGYAEITGMKTVTFDDGFGNTNIIELYNTNRGLFLPEYEEAGFSKQAVSGEEGDFDGWRVAAADMADMDMEECRYRPLEFYMGDAAGFVACFAVEQKEETKAIKFQVGGFYVTLETLPTGAYKIEPSVVEITDELEQYVVASTGEQSPSILFALKIVFRRADDSVITGNNYNFQFKVERDSFNNPSTAMVASVNLPSTGVPSDWTEAELDGLVGNAISIQAGNLGPDCVYVGLVRPKGTVEIVNNSYICANGNPLLIMEDGTGTTIYIDDNSNGMVDEGEKSLSEHGIANAPADGADLSRRAICGSTSNRKMHGAYITMRGGCVGGIYGSNCYAGNPPPYLVLSDITINLFGGKVNYVNCWQLGAAGAPSFTGGQIINVGGDIKADCIYVLSTTAKMLYIGDMDPACSIGVRVAGLEQEYGEFDYSKPIAEALGSDEGLIDTTRWKVFQNDIQSVKYYPYFVQDGETGSWLGHVYLGNFKPALDYYYYGADYAGQPAAGYYYNKYVEGSPHYCVGNFYTMEQFVASVSHKVLADYGAAARAEINMYSAYAINGSETLCGVANYPVTMVARAAMTSMLSVDAGEQLTLKNMILRGSYVENSDAEKMVAVAAGGGISLGGIIECGSMALGDGVSINVLAGGITTAGFIAISTDSTALGAVIVRYADGIADAVVEAARFSLVGSSFVLAQGTGENADALVLTVPIALYLDGENGDDANNGLSPASAVKTIKKAYELGSSLQSGGAVPVILYVCGEVVVSNDITLTSTSYMETDEGGNVVTSIAVSGGVAFSRYSQPTHHDGVVDEVETVADEWMASALGIMFRLEGSHVVVENISFNGHRYASAVDGAPAVTGAGAIFQVGMDSILEIKDGAGIYENDGTAIVAYGRINMSGGVISGSNGVNGGGISLPDGESILDISGGIIADNTADYGGAVYARRGVIEMSGGEMRGNLAKKIGGAVYCSNGAYFAMSNGIISNNATNSDTVYGSGGAIAILSYSFIEITGGILSQNKAARKQSGKAGALYISNSNAIIANATITGNTSSAAEGGAIYCYDSTLSIKDSVITNNTAAMEGGVISARGTNLTVEGTRISNNTASSNGGGIMCLNSTAKEFRLILANSLFYDNYAKNSGGGVCTSGNGKAEIRNCSFLNNVTEGSGGGVGCRTVSGQVQTIDMYDCVVENNRSAYSGGGIGATSCIITVNGGSISNNEAGSGGGGIAALHNISDDVSSYKLTVNNTEICNNTLLGDNMGGGGIYTAIPMVLKGCAINGNAAMYGGGVRCDASGSIEIIDSELNNNTITSYHGYGGGISLGGVSNTTITNTKICDNKTPGSGGGIHMYHNPLYGSSGDIGSKLTINGGAISGNTAVAHGGGIYVEIGLNSVGMILLNVVGVTVSNNTASPSGGGIYVQALKGASGSITVNVTDSNVVGNKALGGAGGGIYASPSANATSTVTLSVSGGTVSGNTAYTTGGGIYTNTCSTVAVADCTISENQAGSGGGMDIVSATTVTLNNTSINNNRAVSTADTNGGGGIAIAGTATTVELTAVEITHNSAGYEGGGILITKSGTGDTKPVITMHSGAIEYNEAVFSGGGVNMRYNVDFIMNDGSIAYNSLVTPAPLPSLYEGGRGGGVACFDGAKFTLNGGRIAGNSALSGGGVFILNTYYGAMGYNLFTMTGGIIENNSAVGTNASPTGPANRFYGGGGIYVYAANVDISGGVISGNTGEYGGGMYYSHESMPTSVDLGEYKKTRLNISGGEITRNNAQCGGAIYVRSSTVDPGGVTFIYESPAATISGGAVYGNTAAVAQAKGLYVYVDCYGSNKDADVLLCGSPRLNDGIMINYQQTNRDFTIADQRSRGSIIKALDGSSANPFTTDTLIPCYVTTVDLTTPITDYTGLIFAEYYTSYTSSTANTAGTAVVPVQFNLKNTGYSLVQEDGYKLVFSGSGAFEPPETPELPVLPGVQANVRYVVDDPTAFSWDGLYNGDESGKDPENPCDLFTAYQDLKDTGGTIFIVDPVYVGTDMTLTGTSYWDGYGYSVTLTNGYINIKRYSRPNNADSLDGYDGSDSNEGYLFEVAQGVDSTLTTSNIVIDGHSEAYSSDDPRFDAPAVEEAESLIYFLENNIYNANAGTVLANNSCAYYELTAYGGGAINVEFGYVDVFLTGAYIINCAAGYGGGICCGTEASVIMDNSVIYGCGYEAISGERDAPLGGGIYLNSAASLELKNGSVICGSKTEGIWAGETTPGAGATITISSGSSIHSNATMGIMADGRGAININNASIYNNGWAGLFAHSCESVTITGSAIYNNGTLTANDGAEVGYCGEVNVSRSSIYGNGDAGISVTNTSADFNFTDSSAYNNAGAGIYCDSGHALYDVNDVYSNNLNITGASELYGNEDGAIYCEDNVVATIEGPVVIRNNVGAPDGGGITVVDASLIMQADANGKAPVVRDNTAAAGGGGIDFAVTNTGKTYRLELSDITISGNTANVGGGIYIEDNGGNVQLAPVISNVTIRDNKAQTIGGGAYIHFAGSDQSLTLNGIDFTENEAVSGGGIYTHNGDVMLTDCNLTHNSAHAGGGIYVVNGELTIQNTTADYLISLNDDHLDGVTIGGSGVFLTNNSRLILGNYANLAEGQSVFFNNSWDAADESYIVFTANIANSHCQMDGTVPISVEGSNAGLGRKIAYIADYGVLPSLFTVMNAFVPVASEDGQYIILGVPEGTVYVAPEGVITGSGSCEYEIPLDIFTSPNSIFLYNCDVITGLMTLTSVEDCKANSMNWGSDKANSTFALSLSWNGGAEVDVKSIEGGHVLLGQFGADGTDKLVLRIYNANAITIGGLAGVFKLQLGNGGQMYDYLVNVQRLTGGQINAMVPLQVTAIYNYQGEQGFAFPGTIGYDIINYGNTPIAVTGISYEWKAAAASALFTDYTKVGFSVYLRDRASTPYSFTGETPPAIVVDGTRAVISAYESAAGISNRLSIYWGMTMGDGNALDPSTIQETSANIATVTFTIGIPQHSGIND